MSISVLLWVVLFVYGAVMFAVSPRARHFGEFFASRGKDGRDVGMGMLIASVVISWIFAKSITNASNLGAKFGVVGAVGYAGWYLSIPVAGIVIYAIRKRFGNSSLSEFLVSKYGHAAALSFLLVIMLRLVNEVWSNTAVVGAYFGAGGTPAYFAAAMVFALFTLFYSLRGGLRSSILTDAIQFSLGIFLLFFVLALVVPRSGAVPLLTTGEWTLHGGVDLLLVALLQSLSYPFHDPVLTDRAFITRPGVMLRGYLWAGLIAAAFIVLFGLTGVHSMLAGLDSGQDAPLRVAQSFGVAVLAMMTVMMMVSAGSTLDSTLASFSRAAVVDVGGRHEDGGNYGALWGRLGRRLAGVDPVRMGRVAMVGAVIIGSLPLFAGAAILKATTVSGTMVLGLAPAFLLFAWTRARTFAFHLGFWPGVMVGIMYALGAVPESWYLGDGPYATLLGANVYGTLFTFSGYAVGAWVDGLAGHRRVAVAGALVLVAFLFLLPGLARADEDDAALSLSGQTMLRTTFKIADPDRPSSEVYNVRLVATRTRADVTYLAEVRFRQTPLRSYSPSNVWLQQAYAAWTPPVDGLRLSAGLIYNQLGLFWDGSWFGNLPYLNGHKLDPDMNLEARYTHSPESGPLGVDAWLQISPAEDGLNGSFATGSKLARVGLLDASDGNAGDLEASKRFREGPSARLRVVPALHIGGVTWSLGASAQYSTYDRTAPDSLATTGKQLVGGVETSVRYRRVHVFGEYLSESIDDLDVTNYDRDYFLAGAELTLVDRDAAWWPLVRTGASWQETQYDEEGFDEWFVTARVFAKARDALGVTLEYVRWEIDGLADPVLDRFEFILHVYY